MTRGPDTAMSKLETGILGYIKCIALIQHLVMVYALTMVL